MATAVPDERVEELESLTAIFPELVIDSTDIFTATLELPIAPTKPLLVRFVPSRQRTDGTYAGTATNGIVHVERDVELPHLPPLTIRMKLPQQYPSDVAPQICLATQLDWLPQEKIRELEGEVTNLWEEYGHCQILYTYIDYIQQAAESGFHLDQSADGCLVLPSTQESTLVALAGKIRQATFDTGTYDCGVCLEPKKGSVCYQMSRCGHVFCRQCLQDFYNNAIKEGDVTGVKCLDPSCGKETGINGKKKRKRGRTVHPRELLAMGVDENVVRRYAEMKRKKKMEADKSTVYCPRTWCQSPAKSDKYPSIPADLTAYVDNEVSDDDSDASDTAQNPKPSHKAVPPNPADRLVVCEKCQFAFCKVCYMGWHGPFARCFPRDPNELSAEEKASYEYIRLHTSPCPYCNAPVQKTMGCNHMNCFQCQTHFCYLCGSWLDAGNPYQHYSKAGTPCYQRLWELEEGDEGQAPADGRGFLGGGRGWEQLAVEVARQADEAEAEAAVAQAQAEEAERDARQRPAIHPPGNQFPLVVPVAPLELHHAIDPLYDDPDDEEQPPVARQPAVRRRRNPFPAHAPARGAARAVRNHERARPGGARAQGQHPVRAGGNVQQHDLDDREQAELQRFLELAQRDEEDGWDSDELDDERFIIPIR